MHSIECVAGRGIRGDRFFDYRDDYKGQITFFSREVFDLMTQALGVTTKSPAVLRRNVIVSGIDLVELIGVEFRTARRAVPGHRALQALLLDEHRFRARR